MLFRSPRLSHSISLSLPLPLSLPSLPPPFQFPSSTFESLSQRRRRRLLVPTRLLCPCRVAVPTRPSLQPRPRGVAMLCVLFSCVFPMLCRAFTVLSAPGSALRCCAVLCCAVFCCAVPNFAPGSSHSCQPLSGNPILSSRPSSLQSLPSSSKVIRTPGSLALSLSSWFILSSFPPWCWAGPR